MFGKIKCRKCGKKSNKDFNFCPSCGTPLKDNAQRQREYGMLGEQDMMPDFGAMQNSMFGGIGGNMLNKMLAGTMKMLEQELAKEMRNNPQTPQNKMPSNFQLYINGKKVNLTSQDQNQAQNQMQSQTSQKSTKKKSQNESVKKYFTKENKEKFSKLPQHEPKTDVKRLSDSIIYELETPGVKSIEDVSIVQLSNSIEVKALSKDKAYSKTIKLGLPLIACQLEKDKLVIEFQTENTLKKDN
jgi:HSP20 family molecular chaperone IbpA